MSDTIEQPPDIAEEETEEDAQAGPLDIHKALRNALVQIQAEPQRYHLFGIWWPFIKAALKRVGYGRQQLAMLGDYQMPEIAAMIPHASLHDTMQAALEEYRQNATFPRSDGRVENADGELVTVYDEDAGL